MLPKFLFPFVCLLPQAWSWGEVGHGTVAAIAEKFLAWPAESLVKNTLFENETLVSVASWADAYRRTPAGKFSGVFHFIDAEDNPPIKCNVSYKRDCIGAGCIVSATTNYTQRLQNEMLSANETNQALKFLVHFLGDITQPLHDEAQAFGGNKIPVTWNGQLKNLHGCWDDEMVNRLAGAGGTPVDTAIANLAETLSDMIRNGTWSADELAGWVSCVDPAQAEDCALAWATDANKWICDYVLKTPVANTELNGTYYDGAKPIIEMQLAKGGYRLAYYLNNLAIVNNSKGKKEEQILVDAAELKA